MEAPMDFISPPGYSHVYVCTAYLGDMVMCRFHILWVGTWHMTHIIARDIS